MTAGFWQRSAAAWVDLFVIYALSNLVVFVGDLAHIRCSLEPVFVIVGAAYGVAMLARYRQTVGKMLLGVTISDASGSRPGLSKIFIREALGKWALTVAAPIVLGRALVGRAWLPSVYDLALLIATTLLILIYLAVFKRAWYDQLAGTIAEREPWQPGQSKKAFAALFMAVAVSVGVSAAEVTTRGTIVCPLAIYHTSSSTAPYATFLQQSRVSDVDYIISLFDNYDVVVLCERLHPEASQWELISRVVADPRFVDRAGHVFTELGHEGMQKHLDEFMAADGLSDGEVHARALAIMRNMAVWPVWQNANFYNYLKKLYSLNQTLPAARRVRHHFTDAPIDWASTAAEGYRQYTQALPDRDRHMGLSIVDGIRRIEASTGATPKCLVIMNYRHAFDLTEGSPTARRLNAFEFLKDALGQRVANVLLNYWFFAPVAGGVWDAAFEEVGNPRIGFTLEGTPFGNDPFDLYPFRPMLKGRQRFSDIFTGFVFAQPLSEQYLQVGIPGYFRGIETEVLRRAALLGEDYRLAVEKTIGHDQNVDLPVTSAFPNRFVESAVSLTLLGLCFAGVPIGCSAYAVRRHHGRRGR